MTARDERDGGENSDVKTWMKRPSGWRIFFLAAILVVAVALLWKKHFLKPGIPMGLPTSGGTPLTVRIDVESYRQWDPRWSGKKLGSSRDLIGTSGCTLCALSMALQSQGLASKPDELNALLRNQGGYTDSGLLVWGAVPRATDGRYRIRLDGRPTHKVIDRELSRGNPVIAKVLFGDEIWHWVLISGKRGQDYLINDPLGSGRAHEDMTNYAKGIYAVRYLEKL